MPDVNEKIKCAICGAEVHVMKKHLEAMHPKTSLDDYMARHPDEPIYSALALATIAATKQKKADEAAAASGATVTMMAGTAEVKPVNVTTLIPKGTIVKKIFHEVFELPPTDENLSLQKKPISISTLSPHDQQDMVPPISHRYVYDSDELKDVILALEFNIPCYIWGHKGSGKSEMLEQVNARTNRPQIRIQHTVNTEESHILGQWTVKGGETVFELGPLALAMINGWTYIADEYDFGMPSVLAVYQPVLEGKALVIKEAPADMRVIQPHPNFRFAATGNTNGSGDETGLYQGTLIQNSANYDRFGMVINKKYMKKSAESQILQNHCGLNKIDADRMIDFATQIREAYDGAKMSDTISPRTLIFASRIGVMRGSFRHGLTKSFIGKLSKIDREVADQLAQRVFGK